MIKIEIEKRNIEKNSIEEKICNLSYLSKTVNGKKHLIIEIIDVFLKQVSEELQSINDAIDKTDYASIKNLTHTMQSSVFIMGIAVLAPVLQEMENLGASTLNIEKIKDLNNKLNLICKQAIVEIQ